MRRSELRYPLDDTRPDEAARKRKTRGAKSLLCISTKLNFDQVLKTLKFYLAQTPQSRFEFVSHFLSSARFDRNRNGKGRVV